MAFPATTVKVVSIDSYSESKVRIMIEMIADVHRLADISSELLHATVRSKADAARKKR